MAISGATVHLVSCVKKKCDRSVPARNLYVSSWFSKAREYVEALEGPWFILSAEYGLLSPGRIVSPYERTLNKMARTEREAWAQRVLRQMETKIPNLRSVVFLAGMRYRESLAPALKARGIKIYVPMEGLGIGSQLRWLKQHAPSSRRPL